MRRLISGIMAMGMLLAGAAPAFSAGFAIIEQSVKGLGNAFAGGAAVAEDASTVYFNPAGLTRLEGNQAIAALHLIDPRSEFDPESASTGEPLGLPFSVPITGNDGGQGGEPGLSPNLYFAARLPGRWAVGLGINAPFGLITEWDDGWVGRYHALRSEVETVNINPTVACRVNDHLSLGLGASAQYVHAKLTNAIDFGTIAFVQSGFNPAFASFRAQPAFDGKADLEADDWGYGWNVGLLYEFTENTRIGASYRSEVEYRLEGDADFFVPGSVQALPTVGPILAASFANTDAEADVTLPGSAQLSLYHRFNPRWAVMADVMWTNWSEFHELRVEFDSALPDNVTDEKWEDNWRYSAGVTFTPNDRLALRAGVAFDETAIPNAEHRTPRIPGEDRLWTAVGAAYRFTDRLGVDVAYAHLFVSDSDINQIAGTDPSRSNFFRGNLKGEFENVVDIASLEISYTF